MRGTGWVSMGKAHNQQGGGSNLMSDRRMLGKGVGERSAGSHKKDPTHTQVQGSMDEETVSEDFRGTVSSRRPRFLSEL